MKQKNTIIKKITAKKTSSLFDSISEDAQKLLNAFDDVVQSVLPLNSKQLQELPKNIRQLSHELTDKRSSRKSGYMNSPVQSSAYIRYFMWWNLVRLVYLFQNIDIELNDGDFAIDMGAGPLTVVCAMWIAYPEFREKKITWYCTDSSLSTLARGEEIFLSLAARTPLKDESAEPWKIIKIKGGLNSTFKEKASLVTCANMLNEVFWNAKEPQEVVAKNVAQIFSSLTTQDGSVLVIEPGIPLSGKFITLLRSSLMKRKFFPLAPCPHVGECPLPGIFSTRQKFEGKAKWCHFVFSGSKAPLALQKRSQKANLEKERISLSFVFAKKNAHPKEELLGENLFVRITSDPIKLPRKYSDKSKASDSKTQIFGRYACSCGGLVLLEPKIDTTAEKASSSWTSGTLLEIAGDSNDSALIDSKSGARRIIISPDK